MIVLSTTVVPEAERAAAESRAQQATPLAAKAPIHDSDADMTTDH
jgi:hypothetical protein